MHIILVGAGSIGTQVLALAEGSNHEIVVIERDERRAERVGQEFDCLMLNADATETDTLRDAGAAGADAIITTTDADATNVMVLLLAKEFGIGSLVTVVQDPEHMSVFRQVGATTLENPQRLVAEFLYRAVESPSIVDVMHLAGQAEVFEVMVPEDAPIAGHTLYEADEAGLFGTDVLVVAVERGEEVVTPRGDTEVRAGDLLTVFSRTGITREVLKPFGGTAKRRR